MKSMMENRQKTERNVNTTAQYQFSIRIPDTIGVMIEVNTSMAESVWKGSDWDVRGSCTLSAMRGAALA